VSVKIERNRGTVRFGSLSIAGQTVNIGQDGEQ
jgi:hypothetical protein